jgi:hypothetical protein
MAAIDNLDWRFADFGTLLAAWRTRPCPTIQHGAREWGKPGKSIIHGKTVTGFMIEGELIFRILDKLTARR